MRFEPCSACVRVCVRACMAMPCLSSLRPQAARERLIGFLDVENGKKMRRRRPHGRSVERWALGRPLRLAFEFELTRRRGALTQGSATLQPAVDWPELYPRTLHSGRVYACVYPCVRGHPCLSCVPQAARERLTGCTSDLYVNVMRRRRPHGRAVERWARLASEVL